MWATLGSGSLTLFFTAQIPFGHGGRARAIAQRDREGPAPYWAGDLLLLLLLYSKGSIGVRGRALMATDSEQALPFIEGPAGRE